MLRNEQQIAGIPVKIVVVWIEIRRTFEAELKAKVEVQIPFVMIPITIRSTTGDQLPFNWIDPKGRARLGRSTSKWRGLAVHPDHETDAGEIRAIENGNESRLV